MTNFYDGDDDVMGESERGRGKKNEDEGGKEYSYYKALIVLSCVRLGVKDRAGE